MWRPDSRMLLLCGSWVLLFAAAVLAYWPGLSGPFVLDDYGSIAKLADHGGVTDWDSFKAFVFGGNSGPTGRPLSLLTFLLDGSNWPTDPLPFKRTNLIIHLLNGALLGLLVGRILQILEYDRGGIRWIAFVSAAVWLLHPFLVSTTLYPVQRMAQLATLFMLAGLVSFLYARTLVDSNKAKGYVLMSMSLACFGLLALISKENGILLPILALVLEITVLASQRDRYAALDSRWVSAFLGVPTAVIILYLGWQFFRPDFFESVPPREFSLYERLLTQPRVLVDYLQHWFIPKLYTTGVFQDHFIKSTSLLAPITTILAAGLNIGLIAVAFVKRRTWPLFALAILFFYGNHLLESTVLNLELYFEHRNYMSACLLLVPLVAFMWRKTDWRLFAVASLGIMVLLAGFTRYSSTIWQTLPGIVEASARKAPTSARAQVQYATLLFSANQVEEGMRVLDDAIVNIPGDTPLVLVNRMIALCKMDNLEVAEYERVAEILSNRYYDARMLQAYSQFAKDVTEQKCPNISLRSLLSMFGNMLNVPRNADETTVEYTHINFLLGYVHVYLGEPAEATARFLKSLEAGPGASYAMAMAGLLATSNFREEALLLSNIALAELGKESETTLLSTTVSEKDIREFQATIRAEMDAQRDVTVPDVEH